MANLAAGAAPPSRSWSIYDKEVQAIVFQVVFLFLVAGIGYYLFSNMLANQERQNIQTGFEYLEREAGFGIGEGWVEYSPASSYSRAIFVGFINTVVVAVVGVVLATMIGIFVGVASLSRNWLVNKLTAVYIHFLRNIPVLLQIILWYTLITSPRFLPVPRDFLADDGPSPVLGLIYFTRRGIFFPSFEAHVGWLGAGIGLLIGVLGAILLANWARRRMEETGQQFPTFWAGVGVVVGAAFVGWLVLGAPTGMSFPEIGRFRVAGGATITPEFMAVLFGLTIYTSAFIAEIVRSGILSVPRGQIEAGRALGIRESVIMNKVILPQALRVIIPPLTSQYLNLTKNSSLAVAVGYPDLVNVSNTTLNQTGQAPEAIMIMMIVYLTTSIVTSLVMNWYNTRIQLVER
ncbi:MAG: amino acid ABC transporter permease [Hyphomicrobiaceae bacterium]